MGNKVAKLKPTLSNKTPAMEGPTKAPRANEDDQRPETRP